MNHVPAHFPAHFLPLADDNGGAVMAELLHDFLMKAAIVGVLVVIVLTAMVIIWKKVGTKP
ncbi:MAG TPA: hypothetical protein VHX38_28395 [Pseudonocardiaceae bacterium]|jgi:hypothetical protein|nr:hypothetical protein [Pseudonocardiaceae bacterium]